MGGTGGRSGSGNTVGTGGTIGSGSAPSLGGAPNSGGIASGGALGGGASSAPGASCQDLPVTCGSVSNEDCCSSPLVAGGTFRLGDGSGPSATLSAFHLDRFEITVGRFRRFLQGYDAWRSGGHPAAGDGAHLKIPGSGWDATWNSSLAARATSAATLQAALKCDAKGQTWTDAPGENENRPINCINWFEAFAFCAWDGGRLPTEAEFNYAQAGGSEQRHFPWSDPPGAQTLGNPVRELRMHN